MSIKAESELLWTPAVPEGKLRMRRKAVAALHAHRQEGLQQLKDDPDEMLRGCVSVHHP